MNEDRVRTPPMSVDVAAWLASLPIGDVAYVHGAAFHLLASAQEMTESDLYVEFAARASRDPDARVIW